MKTRNFCRTVISVSILAALTACGGGGSSTGPTVVPQVVTPAPRPGDVVAPTPGTTPPETVIAAAAKIADASTVTRMRALSMTSTAYGERSSRIEDCLFSWAESTYPNDVRSTTAVTSGTSGEYYYRYYKDSNTYVGVSSKDKHVYFLAPSVNPGIIDLGEATLWYSSSKCGSPSIGVKASKLSYENSKGLGIAGITIPTEATIGSPGPFTTPYAIADFFQTGSRDLFTANFRFLGDTGNMAASYSDITTDPKYHSDFQIWHMNADGTYVKVWEQKGCVSARKAVVADFNNDGYPDLFIACHDVDVEAGGAVVNGVPVTKGEESWVVMSDGKGGFKASPVPGTKGFRHGAATLDVNNDGYPDIVTAGGYLQFLINNKDGTFTLEEIISSRTGVRSNGSLYNVEAVDLNGDGVVDLVAGGHEFLEDGVSIKGTQIMFGDGTGHFPTSAKIPSVAGRGIVNDFTLVTNHGVKGLFVGRTSDQTSTWGHYGSNTMQWVNLATMESTILFDRKSESTDPSNTWWMAWWEPVTKNGENGVSPYYAWPTKTVEFISH